jgi:hypothetical protein
VRLGVEGAANCLDTQSSYFRGDLLRGMGANFRDQDSVTGFLAMVMIFTSAFHSNKIFHKQKAILIIY